MNFSISPEQFFTIIHNTWFTKRTLHSFVVLFATYELVFESIKEKCPKCNLGFPPKTITANFESAIHRGIKSVFPECEIEGSRFHLSQYWYGKIQELRLSLDLIRLIRYRKYYICEIRYRVTIFFIRKM